MRKLLFIAITILLVTSASAQQEVILDHVTNSLDDTTLIAGRTHTISLRYRNFSIPRCDHITYNLNNGFVLFSPDGASWDRTIGKATNLFLEAAPWTNVFIRHFEDPVTSDSVSQGDGISPDYLNLAAVGGFFVQGGLPFGYDEPTLTIEIATELADTNLHICLDSSSLGKLNSWGWPSIVGLCSVIPEWGGPYCFTIVAPGCSGDVNSDGQVNNDDVMFLVQFYFGLGEYPALGTGDVNNDAIIDIGDIVYLANFLHNGGPAPCAGTGPGGFDWKDKPDSRQAGND